MRLSIISLWRSHLTGISRWATMALLACSLIAALTIGSASTARAQVGGQLTWAKLLDRRPAVIAFSPTFATDRLALLGSSNRDNEHGIWRSTDGGETWVKSSNGIPDSKAVDVYDIVFSPDFAIDRTVFASVNKNKVMMKEASGALYHSTDGGQSWQEIPMNGFPSRGPRPLQDLISFDLSPAFASDGTLFAVDSAIGIYRSTDRGSTWKQLKSENALEVRASPNYANDHMVVAATNSSGILISNDGGDTWSPHNTGMANARNFRQVIFSAGFAKDKTILAMSSSDGIFITHNAGESWINIAQAPQSSPMAVMAATPYFMYDGALAYSLNDAEIYLSQDLGKTWKKTHSAGILGRQIQALFMSPDYKTSRTLYALSVFNGLYRYYPVQAGSSQAEAATAVAIQSTATAQAIPTLMAQQQQQQAKSEIQAETGCITFWIAPPFLLGIWILDWRYRHRRQHAEK